MAAFQIMISPPTKNPLHQKNEKTEEIIPRLILAPFSDTAEVKFGEVGINSVQSKNLIIFNPTPCSVTIQFTNIEVDDRIFMSDFIVPLASRQERLVVVSWSPIHSGYLRKVIRAQDTTRRAKSYDIVLCGMAVSRSAPNGKRRKTKTESKMAQKYNCDSTVSSSLSYTSIAKNPYDFRRETYLVEEKENRLPNNFNNPKSLFKSSSPKTDNSQLMVLHENSSVINFGHNSFNTQDSLDAVAKYSSFELEFNTSSVLGANLSDEVNAIFDVRRNTFAMDIKEEDIVLSPKRRNFSSDSLDNAVDAQTPAENKTFDLKCCDADNIFLTPAKQLNVDSLILTPEQDEFNVPKSSSNCLYDAEESFVSNISFKAVPREEFLFISPPMKSSRPIRKSPDHFIHRTGSSAIKDRRKHLRTSFMNRKKPSPKKMDRGSFSTFCESSMDKIRMRNPNALKQIVSSQCHIEDPFLKQLVYNDDQWIDGQEKDIIKWMNSVLVPPAELCEESFDWTVDGAEAWLKRNHSTDTTWCINKVPITFYNAPEKLDILRKRRKSLMESEFVQAVFSGLSSLVSRKVIFVRDGRDIYADEGIKNKLLQLLACYNPVWLRMGLEAVYAQEIPLQSKADFGGLGLFIRKQVVMTSSHLKKTEKQKEVTRRNILLRFLQLIFFMDQARIQRLVRHNRCLFTHTSKIKSSQELLSAFCADLVTGRGYVLKHLKSIGYTVQFKQTCIDEYNYTVSSVKDLNDGIRLTRLFEVLFSVPDLCSKLRVPAVDIENKKYNVEVAMRIAKSRCTIEGNITAEDFVLATRIGSRMKILSFLWQIINNYLTPMYEKTAIKIQRWWRKCMAQSGSRFKSRLRREESAKLIQTAWRHYMSKKKALQRIDELEAWRSAAVTIQMHFRGYLAMKKDRENFLKTIRAVRTVQSWFRCRMQRRRFLSDKNKVIQIQRRFRALRSMKQCRSDFIQLKKKTVFIQQVYRASVAMRIEWNRFLCIKQAAITIQQFYRSSKEAKLQRGRYLLCRKSAILIQRRFRATKLMHTERANYWRLRSCAVKIQRRFKAMKLMKSQRQKYLEFRHAVVQIQRRFRANKMMKRERQKFLVLKNAAVTTQKRYRANVIMRRQHQRFLELKKAAVRVQQRYRAIVIMRKNRGRFLEQKKSALIIQQRYRAIVAMRKEHQRFLELKKSALIFQQRYRAILVMRRERDYFLKLRESAIFIQRSYLNLKLASLEKANYTNLRTAAIAIQRRFRANKLMKSHRDRFNKSRLAAVKIQRYFRGYLLTCQMKDDYLNLRKYVMQVQQRYRARVQMKKDQFHFLQLKSCALKLQQWYRGCKHMRKEREKFLKARNSALLVQRRFRARKLMLIERSKFERLQWAAKRIQTYFRSNRAMRAEQQKYLTKKKVALAIQRRYRANVLMRQQKSNFESIKTATVKIQKVYMAWMLMRKERVSYLRLKLTVIEIQRKYRAMRVMRQCRSNYLQLRMSTVVVQRQWRMKMAQNSFVQKKEAAVRIQRWWLAAMFRKELQFAASTKPVLSKEELAAIKIQTTWRGYVERKKYLLQKSKPIQQERKEIKENLDFKSTLEERYKKAIHQIKTSDLYNVITYALWNLETVTTFSAKLCDGVASEGIVPIVFDLMSRGNRSEPSMELYRASVSILINLTLYEPTKVILWSHMHEIEDVLRIIHIMKMTHDKFTRHTDTYVFLYCVSFLWLLCQDPNIAEHIANIPTVHLHVEKMKETLKRRCPCTKKCNSKRLIRTLPKTVANWYADLKSRTFDDHCFAISNLYNILFSNPSTTN